MTRSSVRLTLRYPGDEDWSEGEALYDSSALGSLFPSASAGGKFVVESILGWRKPLSEEQLAAEK